MKDVKIYKLLLSIIIFFNIGACQEKDLDLSLVETACKDFKINTPSYVWIADPSCGATSVDAQINISFSFSGDKDCIDKIFVSPKSYQSNNTEIANVSFLDTFVKADTAITLENKTVTIRYRFQFPNIAAANDFNHIYFKIHTENELGNKSKNLEIRINGRCSTVDPNTYSVIKDIQVDSAFADIKLSDDGSEDGDIVSVYLNDKWVLENYTLSNSGETFAFPVNKGDNHLVLFAVNEGKVGPNTVALSINGTDIKISPDLLKGEAVNIKRF